MRDLRARLLSSTTRVVSVDVFDTLLLRAAVPEPEHFRRIARTWHRRLQEAGAPSVPSPTELARLRLQAQRTAYANTVPVEGCREARHAEILALVCAGADLPADWVATLAEAEVDHETRVLRANRRLCRRLAEARGEGKRLIAVSDMYLGADQLTTLLERVLAGRVSVDAVYSSADHRVSKSRGPLFDVVTAQEGVAPAQVLHLGDNRRSDVEQGQAKGLETVWLPRSRRFHLVRDLRHKLFRAQWPDLRNP
jgi:predicted HAD superfamily hydrolase